MERILEPELMLDEAQASAYAEADFDEPHGRCIALFNQYFRGVSLQGAILDLGCGPGDIAYRFARAHRRCVVHAVDGSPVMLAAAVKLRKKYPRASTRVTFIQGLLPDVELPRARYDAIISNSLLHHLHNPQALWDTVKRYAAPGAPIFIMDLMRPTTLVEAAWLTELYTKGESPHLKEDFHNSLLAAFEPDEVRQQLKDAGLGHLSVTPIGDRHLAVSGYALP